MLKKRMSAKTNPYALYFSHLSPATHSTNMPASDSQETMTLDDMKDEDGWGDGREEEDDDDDDLEAVGSEEEIDGDEGEDDEDDQDMKDEHVGEGEEQGRKELVRAEETEDETARGVCTEVPDSQPIVSEVPDSQPIGSEVPDSQPIGSEVPDSQPIVSEVPDSQPILEHHQDSYQEPVDPEPQPLQDDDLILIEDSPAPKKSETIEKGVLEKHLENRAAVEDQISEITTKLNNAKKLLTSKHFG